MADDVVKGIQGGTMLGMTRGEWILVAFIFFATYAAAFVGRLGEHLAGLFARKP
jgi:hypothetical protein